MYLIPAAVFFLRTSSSTPGCYFSKAVLNTLVKSEGNEVTMVSFPSAACAMDVMAGIAPRAKPFMIKRFHNIISSPVKRRGVPA